MKPTVYVETTVISYLAAARSKDLVVGAHQQITREWWDRRNRFELVVSQAVIDEVSRGMLVSLGAGWRCSLAFLSSR